MKPPADQLPLDFAAPAAPRHNSTDTSMAAALEIAPHVGRLQRIVLAAVYSHGPLTRHELHLITMLKENTINGRCGELLDDRPGHYPLLYDTKMRRDKRSVLDLTERGRAVYDNLIRLKAHDD